MLYFINKFHFCLINQIYLPYLQLNWHRFHLCKTETYILFVPSIYIYIYEVVMISGQILKDHDRVEAPNPNHLLA